jgi:hypothetical protein
VKLVITEVLGFFYADAPNVFICPFLSSELRVMIKIVGTQKLES